MTLPTVVVVVFMCLCAAYAYPGGCHSKVADVESCRQRFVVISVFDLDHNLLQQYKHSLAMVTAALAGGADETLDVLSDRLNTDEVAPEVCEQYWQEVRGAFDRIIEAGAQRMLSVRQKEIGEWIEKQDRGEVMITVEVGR